MMVTERRHNAAGHGLKEKNPLTDKHQTSKDTRTAPKSTSPALDRKSVYFVRWMASLAAERDYFAHIEQFGKARNPEPKEE